MRDVLALRISPSLDRAYSTSQFSTEPLRLLLSQGVIDSVFMSARCKHIVLSLCLLTSCSGSQATDRHVEPQLTHSAETEPETLPETPPVTNPQLGAALEELCRIATEGNADRSRPVGVRLERMEDSFDSSEHHDVLDTFFNRVERRSHGNIFFEEIAAQAESDGVPGYRCEPLARMLVLQAAGEDDLDRASWRRQSRTSSDTAPSQPRS